MSKLNWYEKLKGDPLPWLLEGEPWTHYKTMTDLLDFSETDKNVIQVKNELDNHPQIQSLIGNAAKWFPESITRHNVADLSHYQLMMLGEFGLTIKNDKILELCRIAGSHREKDGFAIRQTLPEKGAGSGNTDPNVTEWHSLPCDMPIITYSLLLSGFQDSIMAKNIEILKKNWENSTGWFCHFFFVEGIFKKLKAGCPMAGVMALQVFSLIPELRESIYSKNAFEPIKYHYESGKSLYFFGRGKKFWTLKYPFIWYNALYLADVLTRFQFLKGHPLVEELVQWIINSQDDTGRFKPTSIFMCYKDWEFSNKKMPSRWMTFLCCRILKRFYSE